MNYAFQFVAFHLRFRIPKKLFALAELWAEKRSSRNDVDSIIAHKLVSCYKGILLYRDFLLFNYTLSSIKYMNKLSVHCITILTLLWRIAYMKSVKHSHRAHSSHSPPKRHAHSPIDSLLLLSCSRSLALVLSFSLYRTLSLGVSWMHSARGNQQTFSLWALQKKKKSKQSEISTRDAFSIQYSSTLENVISISIDAW